MSVVAFKVSDTINEVTRDQIFTSILIDISAQSCTVNRTSVLTWGSEETSLCTSTSYDEIVIDGYDFSTLLNTVSSSNLSRYDDFAQEIHTIISLKGV